MGKIRVAVVGTGFGRYGLIPAFRLDARCEVVAVCSTSRARAAEVAEELNVPNAYGDFREMFESADFDAVAVATPPAVQQEIVGLALARAKAVFTEKPFALSVGAARRLQEAADEAEVANIVDFIFPEIDVWRECRRLLAAGAVGSLRHVNVRWMMESYDNLHCLATWKTDPEKGGGALRHFGSHVLYYLEWFLGAMSEMRASLAKAHDIARPGDTLVTLAARLHSGVSASVIVSSAAMLGGGHRVEFYGSEGAVVLANESGDHVRGFRLLVGNRASGKLAEVDRARIALPEGVDARVGPVSSLASRFFDWIERGVPTTPSFREGLRVQTLLDAALQSDRAGEAVSIPPSEQPVGARSGDFG